MRRFSDPHVGAWRRLVAAAVLVALAGHRALAVDVTTCGQTVPAGAVGIVLNDITCSQAAGSFVVTLDDRAALDLGGHTLTGGEVGVLCNRRCTITGAPGTIRNAQRGVSGVPGTATRVKLGNVTLENHSFGAISTDVSRPTRVRGAQVSITGGAGVFARVVRLTNFTAAGLQLDVVTANRAILDGCSITANAGLGVYSTRATLRDCTVTGNSGGGIDLRTLHRPHLINSICGRSQKLAFFGESWGVCASD